MKKGLFILLILTIIFGGLFLCIFPDPINLIRHTDIALQDKEIRLPLIKNPRQGEIVGLYLQIDGHLDGKAILIQTYSKNSFAISDTISGDVQLNLGGDWYQDTCYIIYKPLTSKSGQLNIKYKFKGMNNF